MEARGDGKVIEMKGITTRFGKQTVHENLDLDVMQGEVLAIAGGSGSGKSVLLREMILLQKPTAGTIRLFGEDVATLDADQSQQLRERWGVMLQKGGLFSALTVQENVGLPLRERARRGRGLSPAQIDEVARDKLAQTGLPDDAGLKLPDELSGGMLKRAALARALALEPELLFLDEPTSGLDPSSAAGICDLILETQSVKPTTMVIISHDVNLLWRVTDRVAMLGEGRVIAVGPMSELASNPHPIVQGYFLDSRKPGRPAPTARLAAAHPPARRTPASAAPA